MLKFIVYKHNSYLLKLTVRPTL